VHYPGQLRTRLTLVIPAITYPTADMDNRARETDCIFIAMVLMVKSQISKSIYSILNHFPISHIMPSTEAIQLIIVPHRPTTTDAEIFGDLAEPLAILFK
jgi:hypothetical protein